VLTVTFSGWFQCRLATDPDPADEPRGISGSTFATPGEADLDRIIRFQAPIDPRIPGPRVGVTVSRVAMAAGSIAHSLLGADVVLHGQPRFEGRGGLLARRGSEPIHPVELELRAPGISIRRRDWLDEHDRGLLEVDEAALARRAGAGGEWDRVTDAELLRLAGVASWRQLRLERAAALEEALARTREPVRAAALRRRLGRLTRPESVFVRYRLRIGERGGRGILSGRDAAALGIDLDAPWPLELLFGGWDADALCGLVVGQLALPVDPHNEP
jgi:hypothetical protein